MAGDSNVTAAAVNDLGDVAGFATNSRGNTEAFRLRSWREADHLDFPGATGTQAFGVNDGDEVGGDYMSTGSSATADGSDATDTPRTPHFRVSARSGSAVSAHPVVEGPAGQRWRAVST